MNGPTTNGPDASTTDHASAVVAAMPGWRRLLSVVLTAAIVTSAVGAAVGGLSGTAAAKSSFTEDEMTFCDDPVTDRVDEDGDGHLESFTVCISADTMIQDGTVGKRDIPPDHPWNIQEGHPKFAYFGVIEKGGEKRPVLLGINEVEPSESTMHLGIKHEIDIQQQADKRNLFLDDHDIEEIRVMYVESDSARNALVLKDVDTINAIGSGFKGAGKIVAGSALIVSGAVPAGISAIGSASDNGVTVAKSIKKSWESDDHIDTDAYVLANSIRMEHPDDDATATVEVTSNADDADVLIDGEQVGTTPWSGEYPVDQSERSGQTTIKVRQGGYLSESRTVSLSPPESLHFDLDEIEGGSIVGNGIGSHHDWDAVGEGPQLDSGDLVPEVLFPETAAVFSASPNTSTVGQPITFDASNSTGAGNLSYEWDYGDGTIETVSDPLTTHSYDSPGTYTATLTVTDGNATSTATGTVRIENAAPDAGMTVSTQRPLTGDRVTLDAGPSSDPEGSLARYEWDVDGDGRTDATGRTATHAYADPGVKQVTLTVTDGAGNTDSAVRTLNVSRPNAQPQAQFDVQQDTGRTVTFDASASHDPDGAVSSYTWEFGDGSKANGETVTHTYNGDGTYTVRLLVTDDRNATSTASETVSVSADRDTPDEPGPDPTPDGEPEHEDENEDEDPPESDDERTPTPPEAEDPNPPGFGIGAGVGLSALGAAALLAARRLLAG